VALWSAQYLDDRLATADEMIAVAATAGDPERELQGRNWRVCDLGERGDLGAMLLEIEAHERLADRLRLPNYQWWAPMWRSTIAILQGRFEDARALIEEFTEIGRRAEDSNAQLYGEIATYQLDQAFEHFDTIEEAMLKREIGRPAEYAYRAGYSWILAAQGRHDRSREQIEWVTGDGWSRAREDMNMLAGLAEMTQALLVLGEAGPAAEIYERLLPYAERNILNGRAGAGYGFAAHHLGVLAQLLDWPDTATAHFEDALRLNGAAEARAWNAQTHERYGMLLIERGERERGLAMLESALAVARELGIAPLAARVQGFL
jgi:tetratricopeptide (TPR) repeat protein